MSFVGYSTIGGVSCTSIPVAMPIESSQTIVLQFTRSDSLVCGTTQVFDYDNNAYNTVEIGFQCWLKENMRTTHYANGTPITIAAIPSSTDAYCCYPNNDSSTVLAYGLLYNWAAVMELDLEGGEADMQGVCPDGWHVPCEQEWYNLEDYLRSQNTFHCNNQSGNYGKALASTIGWHNSSDICTIGNMPSTNDATGFSAMPAGGFYNYYDGEAFGGEASFWTTTGYINTAKCWHLFYDFSYFMRWEYDNRHCFSVRCLHDEEYSIPTSGNQPCPQTPTVTDYDGNVYNTVQIGAQCWMKENLKTTHYYDGTFIPIGYRFFPENDSSYVDTYGCLYKWVAVMNGDSSSTSVPSNVQGICPMGWHVPSGAEWTVLKDYLGTQTECHCGHNSTRIAKSLASSTGWWPSTDYCTPGYLPMYNNASGFSAVPAGHIYNNGANYEWIGDEAFFWSATADDSMDGIAEYLKIMASFAYASLEGTTKSNAYSVRCLKD